MDSASGSIPNDPLPGSDIFADGQIPETYEQRMMLFQPVKIYREWKLARLAELAEMRRAEYSRQSTRMSFAPPLVPHEIEGA